jgi:hypothetical protein
MADSSTIIPAAYANIFAVMTAETVRIVFGDQRDQVGRVPVSETYVAEIIMTKENAEALSYAIIDSLNVAASPQPVMMETQDESAPDPF